MHLNTGIDLIEVKRMKTAVEKWGERLLNRVFTPKEIEYSTRGTSFYPVRKKPASLGAKMKKNDMVYEKSKTPCKFSNGVYQHLAARFAAKEAVIKSLGQKAISRRPIGWKDIEVVNNEQGKPEIRFNQQKPQNKEKIALSISHTKDYAIAQAIAYE